MKQFVMPPDEYADTATRKAALFFIALLGLYDDGFLIKILLENGVFVFIVLLCFFGSIVPLVDAKSKQKDDWARRFYSAFYSFVVTAVLAAGAYYGMEWNKYGIMIGVLLFGAVMESILAKWFDQVTGTTDFLSIFKLAAKIASAIWDVIRAAKNEGPKGPDNSTNEKT